MANTCDRKMQFFWSKAGGAVQKGGARATSTLDGVKAAWVQDHKVVIEDNTIVEWRVNLKLTFVLRD